MVHLKAHNWVIAACLLACGAASAQTVATSTAAPSGISPSRADGVLQTMSFIIGEPNYSIDSGYQELEEGMYTQPELRAGDKVFAPVTEIFDALGGHVELKATNKTATYTLNGRTVQVIAGSTAAVVNGQNATSDIAPEWRNNNMWVSVWWLFDQFGAYSKWDKNRQRFSASLVLPLSKKTAGITKGGPVVEANLGDQKTEFWASGLGTTTADVILGYQNEDGGWPKVERDTSLTTPINRAALSGFKIKSTVDNDSTSKQIIALARAWKATEQTRFRDGAIKGIEYLLAAQHPSGGWQQYWPNAQGYKARVTFNDDAVANVLEIMRDVALRSGDFEFVNIELAKRAEKAYHAGLDMVLRTQLVVNGKRTGWCAQYDENTLAPAMGRAFELASISGGESVNVIRFLMSIDKPSSAVVQAVQSAVAWLDAAKVTGIKRVRREDRTLEYGFDFVIAKDDKAPPTWARFYDLNTGRPLFAGRDSKQRETFEEVPYERRVKYSWYTSEALPLLKKEYPAWVQQNKLPSVLTSAY